MEDFFEDDFETDYNILDEDLEIEVGKFFRDNLVKTRKAMTAESFNKFSALNENGARVAFVLKQEEAHKLPVEVENYEKKNSVKSNMFKESGNRSFGLDHYEVAIDEYNRAVLFAPRDELGVILANRSAAFYHLEKFEAALRDCKEALKVGYPKHLMFKLEERRARCLLGLKCHLKAMEAFKTALKSLDDAKLSLEKKKKHESDIRIMLKMMEKGQEMERAQGGIAKTKLIQMENNRLKEKDAAPRIKERNPLYPSCSTSVEIKDSCGDAGRYAVATKNIQPGEILVVEEPHCISVLEEYALTHCHKCLIRAVAPFPASCYTCSSIVYCSPECRDSDAPTHKIECDRLLGALWCSHASITCILAVRAVIQKPFEEFIEAWTELGNNSPKLEVSKVRPYISKDYKAFYNLVTHEDKRTAEDLFHRAYMAAWLFRVLKTTSYIPEALKTTDSAESELSKAEIVIAGALLHHIQLLQFNSHEVSEFIRPKGFPDLTKGKSIFIGGGVYPTVALFNHSCNPGIVRYFVGDLMVVRAIRSIPVGAEISENYGPIFTEVEENERKRTLRLQYWFDCNCEACKDHWPLLEDIDPNKLGFKCDTGTCGNILYINMDSEDFMIPCSKCGKSKNIMKGLKALQDTDALYKMASKNVQSGNHEESFKYYLKILKILDETLALPIKDYHLCQQGIRQCVLALGNCSMIQKKY